MTRAKVSEIWDAVVDAGALSPDWAGLPGTDAVTHAQVMARLRSADLDEWASTAARVGFCSNPVRLVGSSVAVDRTSGEVLRSVRLGRRARWGHVRAVRQPTSRPVPVVLSAVRRGHLPPDPGRGGRRQGRAGGGRRQPAGLRDADRALLRCGPRPPPEPPMPPTRSLSGTVPARAAQRPASRCTNSTTRALGQPLCPDCYDYESHVLWQWWAPELWRRFTIALKRRLAQLLGADLDHLGDVASLQYAKVAEYQVRGAVHFHALIRLDGPPDADGFAPAPSEVTAGVLAKVVEQVAAEVTLVAAPVTPGGTTRVLAFGAQVDTRVVAGLPAHRRPRCPAQRRAGRRLPGQVRHQVRHRHRGPGQPPPAAPARHRPLPRRPGRRRPRPHQPVPAPRPVGPHPGLPRTLLDQVPPLLRHPRTAAPGQATRPDPHRRGHPRRHDRRPARPRGRAARRRHRRGDPGHRVLGVRRQRLGQRRRDSPGHRRSRPRPRVRPAPSLCTTRDPQRLNRRTLARSESHTTNEVDQLDRREPER